MGSAGMRSSSAMPSTWDDGLSPHARLPGNDCRAKCSGKGKQMNNTMIADPLVVQRLLAGSILMISVWTFGLFAILFVVFGRSRKRATKRPHVAHLALVPTVLVVIIGMYVWTPMRYGVVETWSALGALNWFVATIWWVALISLPLAVWKMVIGVRRCFVGVANAMQAKPGAAQLAEEELMDEWRYDLSYLRASDFDLPPRAAGPGYDGFEH